MVKLRAIEPEDIDVLYETENDRELWDVGVTTVPYSRDVLRKYILNTSLDVFDDRQVRMMIDNDEGATVGIVDVTNFDVRHQRAELAIVVFDKWRRMGYASEAVRLVLDYCRRVMHLHQLYVVVGNDNIASMRLFDKLGFERIATLKDWIFDGGKYHSVIVFACFF